MYTALRDADMQLLHIDLCTAVQVKTSSFGESLCVQLKTIVQPRNILFRSQNRLRVLELKSP